MNEFKVDDVTEQAFRQGYLTACTNMKIKALLEINKLGGCDAKDEWAKGYDDGIAAAYNAIKELFEGAEPKTDRRIKQIADYYGYESQMDMLTEECGEFIQARNKLRRNVPGAYYNCLEEIADIAIMVEQMKLICGESTISEIIETKLARQIQRIAEDQSDEEPRPVFATPE